MIKAPRHDVIMSYHSVLDLGQESKGGVNKCYLLGVGV